MIVSTEPKVWAGDHVLLMFLHESAGVCCVEMIYKIFIIIKLHISLVNSDPWHMNYQSVACEMF